MALELYFFRHGEMLLNKDNSVVGGRCDKEPLSIDGERQSDLLGRYLLNQSINFNKIYSSTAIRARKTAERVCKIISFPNDKILNVNQLCEQSLGDWEYQSREKIYTPKVIAEIKKRGDNFRSPNGESRKDVEERVYGWMEEEFLKNRKGEDVVAGIFSHKVTIKYFLRRIFDDNPDLISDIDNCSITQVRYDFSKNSCKWSLIRLNDTTHIIK